MKEWFKGLSTYGQYAVVFGVIVAVVAAIGAIGGGGSKSTKSGSASNTPAETQTVKAATPQTTTAKTESPTVTAAPKGDAEVDKHTRAYLNKMATCETVVGLVILGIKRGKLDDITLADDVTKARDVCDTIRGQLVAMDTQHFDDEAAIGFYAVDRYKSGLNAMLAYIDNPRPSKVIEARNKLQEGDASATEAQKQINVRRHVYGLKSYRP